MRIISIINRGTKTPYSKDFGAKIGVPQIKERGWKKGDGIKMERR